MIRKISTTLLKDLLVPASLIAPKNIIKLTYSMPLVYASQVRFSTNTPKLKQQSEETTAEDNLMN